MCVYAFFGARPAHTSPGSDTTPESSSPAKATHTMQLMHTRVCALHDRPVDVEGICEDYVRGIQFVVRCVHPREYSLYPEVPRC